MKKKPIFFISILLAFFMLPAMAQTVNYTSLPKNKQFFARNQQGYGTVLVSGNVASPGYNAMIVGVYKNNVLINQYSQALVYNSGVASFSINAQIHAELSEWQVKCTLQVGSSQYLINTIDSLACGDVYMADGQSNTVTFPDGGSAAGTGISNEYLRSFGNSNFDATSAMDQTWGLATDGYYSVDAIGVWEFELGKQIIAQNGISVCFINGAVSGTPIAAHQKTYPSNDLSTIYNRLLLRMNNSGLASSVKGIFWYQGENDQGNTFGYYKGQFDALTSSWKADYPGFAKIYVMQIHQGCNFSQTQYILIADFFRQAPSFYSNVGVMSTQNLPGHNGCHYAYNGYVTLGDWLFGIANRDLYGGANGSDIEAPAISNAYYTNPQRTVLRLVFGNATSLSATTVSGVSLTDYIILTGYSGQITNMTITGNTVDLTLSLPSSASAITYVAENFYYNTTNIYEGPYIVNSHGIGALAFNYSLSLLNGNAIEFFSRHVYGLVDTVWLQLDNTTLPTTVPATPTNTSDHSIVPAYGHLFFWSGSNWLQLDNAGTVSLSAPTTDATKSQIIAQNGHFYYWNGSAWMQLDN